MVYFGIDFSVQHLQQCCAVLNEFALPRAIVNLEVHAVLAWNSKFLQHTGNSENEIKNSKPEEWLKFSDAWSPLARQSNGQIVEYVACAVRRRFGTDPAPGFLFRSHGKIGYVMLDAINSSSAQFDQGRIAGQEEERDRVINSFHQEVSSSVIAALFLMEAAKTELEEAGLPQAEAVSKASDILAETAEKMARVIGAPDSNPG